MKGMMICIHVVEKGNGGIIVRWQQKQGTASASGADVPKGD